jgi:predicted GNAT family acetyltransferase
MLPNEIESVLDNPAWHALNSHHAHFAIGDGLAKRYPVDVSVIVALAALDAASLRDLTGIIAPGEVVGVGGDALPADASGWTVHTRLPLIQMVSAQPPVESETSETILTLTADDVPDMLALIDVTHPGPFAARTIELGHYIGIRKEGKLVAMAGERMYPPGFCEISAVCTHPDAQAKGYARLLVTRLMAENWQRGDVPFLHVSPTNSRALTLYERLGFRQRRELQFLVISY